MSRDWAVVAGASGALGSAISDALTDRGLRVVGIAGHPDPERGILGADLRDPDAITTALAPIDGPVRAIVHAAGPDLSGGIGDVDPATLTDAFDIKVGGLLRLVRALEGRFIDGSRIIAVSGNLGFDPIPEAVSAGVANAALAALVRQLAAFYGPRGVTCHGIAPGPVETPRFERLIENMAGATGATSDDLRARLTEAIPVRRFTEASDVAWAVDLLMDESAAMMNGSTLFLDGGRRTAIP